MVLLIINIKLYLLFVLCGRMCVNLLNVFDLFIWVMGVMILLLLEIMFLLFFEVVLLSLDIFFSSCRMMLYFCENCFIIIDM